MGEDRESCEIKIDSRIEKLSDSKLSNFKFQKFQMPHTDQIKYYVINNKGLLFFAAIILMSLSCNTSPSDVNTDDTPLGKRNFVWTIDSIDYGALPSNIQLSSIWGSSSTDVWGAAGDASDVRDCLWHYDGIKWSRATEGTPITDFSGNNVVYAVWGSAKNNVWAFGRKISAGKLSAFIMHYDGISWKDATPEDVRQIAGHLYDVHGVNENNIWVGGYEYVLNYNGTNWRKYKVADSIIIGSIATNSKKIYISVYSPWGRKINLAYRFDGEKFKLVDSTKVGIWKFGGLFWATNSKLYSFTNGLISTDISVAGEIDTLAWRKEFSTTTFFSERIVQSAKNIVAVGQWNLVYHFNGNDWAPIQITVPNHTVDPYALFWGVWTDGNELFICDTQDGIIYHGR